MMTTEPTTTKPERAWLLSVPEAAQLLGVSARHLWRLIDSKEVLTVRLGRRVMVPRKALEKLCHIAN